MAQSQPADGTLIRRATAADAAGIARVRVESWRTTYRGIVADSYLAALSVERRGQNWRRSLSESPDQPFVFVAERQGAIVGFASGGRERSGNADFPGELEAIYLLAEAQRGGLGRKLFAAVAGELARRSLSATLLWVLEANASARAFYERLGGKVVAQRQVAIGEQSFIELAYGWQEIGALLGR